MAGVVILIEIISLTTIGSFYVTRFSQAVDQRLAARIKVPGKLMGQNMLLFDSTSDREILQQLLDDQAVDAMVVGANGIIYHSLDPKYLGQSVTQLSEKDRNTLLALMRSPGIEKTRDGQNTYLTSVSPISVVDGRTTFLFAYFKMRTTGAEQQKHDLRNLFICGSLVGLLISSIMIVAAFRVIFTSRINSTLEVLHRAGSGDLKARITTRATSDEIGRVHTSVNNMITSLEQRVNDLAEVPSRILEAEESERRRVSRELHDGVMQMLASIHFRIQGLESKLAPQGSELVYELQRAKKILEDASAEVRHISRNLRPAELDDFGLWAAVRSACENFSQRTGIKVDVQSSCELASVDPDTRLQLYRIVQEALTNIGKHSQASSAWVHFSADCGHIELKIDDNGLGDLVRRNAANGSALSAGGLGLLNMRDRANSAGGTFIITPRNEGGTSIIVRIPVAAFDDGASGGDENAT